MLKIDGAIKQILAKFNLRRSIDRSEMALQNLGQESLPDEEPQLEP